MDEALYSYQDKKKGTGKNYSIFQPSCTEYFPFWKHGKRGENCLQDESIVYNSLYTIYNRSAALSVEKVH